MKLRSALVLVVVLMLLVAAPAAAQEVTPTPTPPPVPAPPAGPSAGDIGSAVLGGLGGVLEKAFSSWIANSLPALLVKGIGLAADWLWTWAAGALSGVNVFTQLPPAWSYQLAPVVAIQARLLPIAQSILAAAVVLSVLLIGYGTVAGRPFGALLGRLPTIWLATGGLLFAPRLCAWWLDLANALSGALLDPNTGIPGLAAVKGWDRASPVGVIAVLYLIIAFCFLLARLKLVVIVALLLAVAPLAIAAGALPIPQAQRFFHWWLTTFLGATAVQVLQSVCLGLGAALLALPAMPAAASASAAPGLADNAVAVGMGIGALLAAMSLPSMVLGSLASTGGAGFLGSAARAGLMLAGVGLVAPAALRAVVHPLAGAAAGLSGAGPMAAVAGMAPAGYTRSLLAETPLRPQLLLPPPKD